MASLTVRSCRSGTARLFVLDRPYVILTLAYIVHSAVINDQAAISITESDSMHVVTTLYGRFSLGSYKFYNRNNEVVTDDIGLEGDLKMILSEMPDGESSWIGIINCIHQHETDGIPPQSVISKVRQALMFGASAILILTINEGIIKEIDRMVSLAKPVIIFSNARNISTFLKLLKRPASLKGRVSRKHNSMLQSTRTVSLWSACGWSSGQVHGRWWAGVICPHTNSDRTKNDPATFWQFFYSTLVLMMFLFVVKTRVRDGEYDNDGSSSATVSLRGLAQEALSIMKTKRYKKACSTIGDICVICLDKFLPKQKIRILPCQHEFHVKCVDTWLLAARTCPLCKCNILEFNVSNTTHPSSSSSFPSSSSSSSS